MNSKGEHRSSCPLACALDLFGDKWTLLVVRDLIFNSHCTFSELQKARESMPTNILAERLKRLEAAKIITKQPYQQKPVRFQYSLTPKGLALIPALKAVTLWGQEYIESAAKVVDVKDA